MQESLMNLKDKDVSRRLEEEFERIAAAEYVPDDLQLDAPFDEEMLREIEDVPFDGEIDTSVSTPETTQQTSYEQRSFDPDVLERFLDLRRYPPCPECGPHLPPKGKEDLNPDLWDLYDPWYRSISRDLIEFDLIDFD